MSQQDDYRIWHRAPEAEEDGTTVRLDRVFTGTVFPDDAAAHPERYGARHGETVKQVRKAGYARQPEQQVTIYRAVPDGVTTIHHGDWVALSRAYADESSYETSTDGSADRNVISAKVPADTLYSEGLMEEWGYQGPDIEATRQFDDRSEILDLNQDERAGVVRELRRTAGEVGGYVSVGDAVDGLRGILGGDPYYVDNPAALEEELAREAERTRRTNELGEEQAAPYLELADRIEAGGQLDLTDPTTRWALSQSIEWSRDDPYSQPPDEMRRVVQAHEEAQRHYAPILDFEGRPVVLPDQPTPSRNMTHQTQPGLRAAQACFPTAPTIDASGSATHDTPANHQVRETDRGAELGE